VGLGQDLEGSARAGGGAGCRGGGHLGLGAEVGGGKGKGGGEERGAIYSFRENTRPSHTLTAHPGHPPLDCYYPPLWILFACFYYYSLLLMIFILFIIVVLCRVLDEWTLDISADISFSLSLFSGRVIFFKLMWMEGNVIFGTLQVSQLLNVQRLYHHNY
jgi:hypothetical protein